MALDDRDPAEGGTSYLQIPGAVIPAAGGAEGGTLAIPQLSHDQAMYISLLMESGRPEVAEREFAALYDTLPQLDLWADDPAFLDSLSLADTNRPLLFRAMSHALFGKAFRALSRMLDSPKSSGKAVELLARLHGMLIDRVHDSRPDEFRELIHMLRQRIEPNANDFHTTARKDRSV